MSKVIKSAPFTYPFDLEGVKRMLIGTNNVGEFVGAIEIKGKRRFKSELQGYVINQN